jgi:hypothetical protein
MASGANTCRIVCPSPYEPYRSGWLRDLAITSATSALTPVFPPGEVTQAAEAAADEAFGFVAELLSQYEPD